LYRVSLQLYRDTGSTSLLTAVNSYYLNSNEYRQLVQWYRLLHIISLQQSHRFHTLMCC